MFVNYSCLLWTYIHYLMTKKVLPNTVFIGFLNYYVFKNNISFFNIYYLKKNYKYLKRNNYNNVANTRL